MCKSTSICPLMSFKKQPNSISTHAPIKSSLRRTLFNAVSTQFAISLDDAKLLVPEGIQAAKFSTHLDAPGVSSESYTLCLAPTQAHRFLLSTDSVFLPLLHPFDTSLVRLWQDAFFREPHPIALHPPPSSHPLAVDPDSSTCHHPTDQWSGLDDPWLGRSA